MEAPEQNPYAPPRADGVEGAPPPPLLLDLAGPRGIGGWLILPLIGLVLNPIRLGMTLVNDLLPVFRPETWNALTTPGQENYHAMWGPLLLFELVTNLLVGVFTVVLLVLFLRKSRRVPLLMIALLAGHVLIQVVDWALVGTIPALAHDPKAQDFSDLRRALIGAAIWIPYFVKSRRVRNTFVN